jgi:hypothetical protein
MKKLLLISFCTSLFHFFVMAQPCTPQGNETTYGTNNVWIGYLYNDINFTSYAGFTNEGIAANPNFDQSFGGDNVMYTTNGCPVNTQTFSARYKLSKTFASGNYEFIVGGDDGYRLSLDGGATWAINNWSDHGYVTTSYAIALNGTYNLVLEFYENAGQNRISFSVAATCSGTEDQTIYGTGNTWRGYVYDGTNFNTYKGLVTIGGLPDGTFNETFGGSYTNYNTSNCPVYTETFSIRYRLRKTFLPGNYTFTIGGDDGYRLSLDGGATWVVNRWWDQSYTIFDYTTPLNGTYDMVLEFYENGGQNRISYSLASTLLPVQLIQFDVSILNNQAQLQWKTTNEIALSHYTVERSTDVENFAAIGNVEANNNATESSYSFTDRSPLNGNNYYRLKMIDKDGKFTYSPVKKINIQSSGDFAVFPTVMNDNQFHIRTGKTLNNLAVQLHDVNGRMVARFFSNTTIVSGQTITYSLDSYQLASGTYIVTCMSNEVKIGNAVLVKP